MFNKVYLLVDRALRALEYAGFLIAAAMLLAAMVLVTLDATLRYFFNAPLRWQYTLTSSYLLVGLVCMAFSWAFRTGGYIRVSGVASYLPPAASRLLIRAGLLLSSAYVATLTWKSAEYFWDSFQSGASQISTIRWPEWISWIWVPAGLGLLSLRLLLVALGPAQDLEIAHEPAEEV